MREQRATLPADSASSDMRSLRSLHRRSFGLAAVSGTMCAASFAVATIPAGCLTAPPPALPDVQHRPTILPDESPAVDVPLVDWPAGFSAYVQVDPGAPFYWAAFLDFDPGNPASAVYIFHLASALPGGGPVNVYFSFAPQPDGLCHRIDLVVGDTFGSPGLPTTPSSFHTPTGANGGDVVTWWYTGGLGLAACSPYGGPLPDGGFPLPDASSDSPPPVPE